MKDIVMYLEGEERERADEVDVDMMVAQSSGVNLSFQEAKDIHNRYDDFWRELRKKHDLDDEELYIFDRQTGAVFVSRMED